MTTWRKSSYSSAGNTCVELAEHDDVVLVRNSNHPEAGILTLEPGAIAALVEDVKAGELDTHC